MCMSWSCFSVSVAGPLGKSVVLRVFFTSDCSVLASQGSTFFSSDEAHPVIGQGWPQNRRSKSCVQVHGLILQLVKLWGKSCGRSMCSLGYQLIACLQQINQQPHQDRLFGCTPRKPRSGQFCDHKLYRVLSLSTRKSCLVLWENLLLLLILELWNMHLHVYITLAAINSTCTCRPLLLILFSVF